MMNRLKLYKILNNDSSDKGAILIALIMVIIIAGTMFTTAVYNFGNIMDRVREEETISRLQNISYAVLGSEHYWMDGSCSNLGSGDFSPTSIPAISSLTDLQGEYAGSDDYDISRDGYGRVISLGIDAGNQLYVRSDGKDSADTTDDIELVSSINHMRRNITVRIYSSDKQPIEHYGADYIYDEGNDSIDNSVYDGSILLDDSDCDVSLSLTAAGAGTAAVYNSTDSVFEFTNVPAGWAFLEIKTTKDSQVAYFDPIWSENFERNELRSLLFVPPGNPAENVHFDIVYPAKIRTFEISEGTPNGVQCLDLVVSEDGVGYDRLHDGIQPSTKNKGHLAIGRFDPREETIGLKRFRSLLFFDINSLKNMSVSAKISSAYLRLHSHRSGASANFHNDNGNGLVRVFAYDKAWNESSNPSWSDVGGWITASTGITELPYKDAIELEFDVTDQVRQWVEGTSTNYGFLIRYATAGGANMEQNNKFYTWKSCESVNNDGNDDGLRPKLIISFYPE